MIYQALYKAIMNNPFDDLPRLAMADYYEENNLTDVSDFIRHQLKYPAELTQLVEWNLDSERLWYRRGFPSRYEDCIYNYTFNYLTYYPITELVLWDVTWLKLENLTRHPRWGYIKYLNLRHVSYLEDISVNNCFNLLKGIPDLQLDPTIQRTRRAWEILISLLKDKGLKTIGISDNPFNLQKFILGDGLKWRRYSE